MATRAELALERETLLRQLSNAKGDFVGQRITMEKLKENRAQLRVATEPGQRLPRRPVHCIHRSADPIGGAIVNCQSCNGRVRLKKPLYSCQLFQKCVTVPTAPEDWLKSCCGCADYR